MMFHGNGQRYRGSDRQDPYSLVVMPFTLDVGARMFFLSQGQAFGNGVYNSGFEGTRHEEIGYSVPGKTAEDRGVTFMLKPSSSDIAVENIIKQCNC